MDVWFCDGRTFAEAHVRTELQNLVLRAPLEKGRQGSGSDCVAELSCWKSPTHSPDSADTRFSRFLGSGRITGNPHLARHWLIGRVMEGLPTIQELVYAPSGNVRIAGFTSTWLLSNEVM
jgi:hypothetical protein